MNDRELLIRFRDGELTEEERDRVERRLREEPELAAKYERLRSTVEALRSAVPDSFGPFFATRVLSRMRAEKKGTSESLYEALRWTFVRVAIACLVLAVGLGVYSAIGAGYGGTIVEAMLGLPEATLETALALGG
jgi:anti-sigma factor RsiW